jgi:hypothetical protein
MTSKNEQEHTIGIESVPPDDDFARWAGSKKLERERERHRDQGQVIGIESTPPDDDWAEWAARKRREHAGT